MNVRSTEGSCRIASLKTGLLYNNTLYTYGIYNSSNINYTVFTKAINGMFKYILFIYLFISKQNEASQIKNYNNPSLNVKTVHFTKLQFEQLKHNYTFYRLIET